MDTSGSKPLATTMESATSLMGAVSAGNTELEKTVLGFLDLPTEIRFEIYGYLLLARIELLPLNTKTAYSVLRPIVLRMRWYQGPRTLVMVDNSQVKGICRSVYPAILSTCRMVHEEARTVLYGNNEFRFMDDPGSPYILTEHESVFREQCDNIFKYNEKSWGRLDGPFLLSDSPIALFLNKIGARNANSLKVVELHVDFIRFSYNTLVTDLLVRHMPALKTLRVLSQEHIRFEDDEADDNPDYPFLHRSEMAIQTFCSTMRDLGRGRFSVEVLKYRGDVFGTAQDLEARPEYSGEFAPSQRDGKGTNTSDTDSS